MAAEMSRAEIREQYLKMSRERCPGGAFHKGPNVLKVYCGECIVGLCAGAWEAGRAAGVAEAGAAGNAAPAGAQKPGEVRTVTVDGKSVSVGYRVVSVPPRQKAPVGPKIADAMKGEE